MVCKFAQSLGDTYDVPKKGKPIRPVLLPGISGKKFRPVVPVKKRVGKITPHPLLVAIDLREGSLASLDAYLKKHRGVPDREVALELRKLLSGSVQRTRYRLVVVDHPDAPPAKGGRPRSKSAKPTADEMELVEEYRAQFDFYKKVEIARQETAIVYGVSVATVKRAIKSVGAAEADASRWKALAERRQAALETLARETKSHETS